APAPTLKRPVVERHRRKKWQIGFTFSKICANTYAIFCCANKPVSQKSKKTLQMLFRKKHEEGRELPLPLPLPRETKPPILTFGRCRLSSACIQGGKAQSPHSLWLKLANKPVVPVA